MASIDSSKLAGGLFALFQSLRPVDCEIEAVGRHTAAVVESYVGRCRYTP